MRLSISKKEFILSVLNNGLNTLLSIGFFIDGYFRYENWTWLTLLSYYINSLNFWVNLAADINLYIRKSSYLEPLNDYFRNEFAAWSNSLSFFVFIIFWVMYFLGGMDDIPNILRWIRTIYLHILVMVFQIMDVMYANHNRLRFKFKHVLILALCIFLYGIECYYLGFIVGKAPYPFLQGVSIKVFSAYCSGFLIVLIFCYLFNIFVYTIKYEKILKIKDKDYYNNDLDLKSNKKKQ